MGLRPGRRPGVNVNHHGRPPGPLQQQDTVEAARRRLRCRPPAGLGRERRELGDGLARGLADDLLGLVAALPELWLRLHGSEGLRGIRLVQQAQSHLVQTAVVLVGQGGARQPRGPPEEAAHELGREGAERAERAERVQRLARLAEGGDLPGEP